MVKQDVFVKNYTLGLNNLSSKHQNHKLNQLDITRKCFLKGTHKIRKVY